MLAMTDINTIRNLRNNHDQSIESIRKTLNINWRTAKKYADKEFLPAVKIPKKSGMMYDEKWGDIVSLWLTEDFKLPRKRRRTNKQFFQDLIEIGFNGSYRTVCNFVKEWKAVHTNKDEVKDLGYEKLEHPAGEAQLDFGTMEVEKDGSLVDIKVLVMTFPYSNRAFSVALPAENQECLLEGIKYILKQAGGVPTTIRIDNMSTAVVKSKTRYKEAQLTNEFRSFALHYGFKVQTCNPRSGYEKGSVENKVGYVRYNFFSNSPRLMSFQDLNQQLAKKLTEDTDRLHYEKKEPISKLWEDDWDSLLKLPEKDYPVFKQIELRANRYNEITIDNVKIHIPMAKTMMSLNCILTAKDYTLYNLNGEIVSQGQRPYLTNKRAIDWKSVFITWKRKLRSIHYSRYWKYLPQRIAYYLSIKDRKLQEQRLDELISLLSTHPLKEINEKFYELIGLSPTARELNIDMKNYDKLAKNAGMGEFND